MRFMWLLEPSVWQAMQDLVRAGSHPTLQQQLDYTAQYEARHTGDGSRALTVAGGHAEIAVQGVLTNRPDFFASIFGGGNVTYPEIISALAEADADDSVTEATLLIDSVGGSVDGLFDTLAAIENFSKPLVAVVTGKAASAAFAIAARADSIEATSKASAFGSIGIAATVRIDPDAVTITSTDAPKKRPDASTDEGVAAIREELDALHELFVEEIAAGRNTTIKKVNAEFGQGAMVLAGVALERGMIDSVRAPRLAAVASTSKTTALAGDNTTETGPMDLITLKAQHPEVYEAAVADGVTSERDRASAHLTAGELSGDMKTALAAAKDGTEMTQTLTMQYMMATANRKDIGDRAADDGDVAAAADGADTEAATAARDKKASNDILASAAAGCGVELTAEA